MSHNATLLSLAAISVAALIFLIVRLKVSSFLALVIVSLLLGLTAGMPLPDIAKVFQEGVGNVLSSIALIVGLGTILGKMLAESGGAEVVARTLIERFGPRRLPWAMVTISLIVGLPVFFPVGLVLLVPILYALAAQKQTPFLQLAIPMTAGLAVAHGFIPPHPGVMAAIEFIGPDLGKTIIYSFIVGVPSAILAGPVFAKWAAKRWPIEPATFPIRASTSRATTPPSFGVTVFTICLPVVLMVGSSVATIMASSAGRSDAFSIWVAPAFQFLGSPAVAMLLAILVSFYTFGFARGYGRTEILKFSEECLGPVAAILLIVGAGGGFNKILVGSGVGNAIASVAKDFQIPVLPMGYVLACLIRLATGSATVAITTAAGLMQPIVLQTPLVNRELLVMAMAAGSSIFSHVNDGGFWFVKEYFQLSVPETLKTWSVMVTIVSLAAFAIVMLLNALL